MTLRPRSGSGRAGALLAGLLAAACGRAPEPSAQPDIVLVLVDTLRADRLPFYGHPVDTAPFLARLAERAVVFERAWATSSWTAPSTASLFTGTYPPQHGVTVGMVAFDLLQTKRPEVELARVPEELETLGEFLRARGYRTFGLADNPNIGPLLGFDGGFERFAGGEDQGAERMLATLAEWGPEIRAARPSFVYLHFMEPHAPYLERAPWFAPPEGADELARAAAAYDSEMRWLDERIERAFELIGVDEGTVVVFVADHGEEFGDHGGRGHGPQLYSELTRVPFFFRAPGLEPRRVAENVSLVDVLPTLRAWLGAPPAPQDAGVSLVPLLRAEGALAPRALFAMRQLGRGVRQAVIEGDEKYIVHEPGDPDAAPRRELYDLARDPGERHDLSAARPKRVQALDARLRAFLASAPRWSQRVTFTPDEELSERLRGLGYAGDDADDHAHAPPREDE